MKKTCKCCNLTIDIALPLPFDTILQDDLRNGDDHYKYCPNCGKPYSCPFNTEDDSGKYRYHCAFSMKSSDKPCLYPDGCNAYNMEKMIEYATIIVEERQRIKKMMDDE